MSDGSDKSDKGDKNKSGESGEDETHAEAVSDGIRALKLDDKLSQSRISACMPLSEMMMCDELSSDANRKEEDADLEDLVERAILKSGGSVNRGAFTSAPAVAAGAATGASSALCPGSPGAGSGQNCGLFAETAEIPCHSWAAAKHMVSYVLSPFAPMFPRAFGNFRVCNEHSFCLEVKEGLTADWVDGGDGKERPGELLGAIWFASADGQLDANCPAERRLVRGRSKIHSFTTVGQLSAAIKHEAHLLLQERAKPDTATSAATGTAASTPCAASL